MDSKVPFGIFSLLLPRTDRRGAAEAAQGAARPLTGDGWFSLALIGCDGNINTT